MTWCTVDRTQLTGLWLSGNAASWTLEQVRTEDMGSYLAFIGVRMPHSDRRGEGVLRCP